MKSSYDMLKEIFGREKTPRAEPAKAAPQQAPKPPKVKGSQPIADPYVGASAQTFYDPSFRPPPPQQQGHTIPEKDMDMGTAPNLSTRGAWGKPEEKK